MTYFFRMSVGACACTAIRVLFLYWATHNVLSSILPFIMNAASPFKCSHKHTADKNLIKCRLKPNRKTHWLIIFYHVPWSYFFFLPPPSYFRLVLPWATSFFSLPKKWRNHLAHLTVAPWDCVKNAKRGAVTRLIRILVSGGGMEAGGGLSWGGGGWEGVSAQGCKEGISCFIPNLHHIPKGQSQHCRQGETYLALCRNN